MAKKKIYTMHDVMPWRSVGKVDSVSFRKATEGQNGEKALSLLIRCNQAWERLRRVREVAQRTENYTFADDQWGDIIETEEGRMTEREYIQGMGNVPLTDNLMISIFSSLTGIYDKQGGEPNAYARDNRDSKLSEMMSATMQCNWQNNRVPRTLSIGWRGFLLSGVVMCRSSYNMMTDGIPDVETRLVNSYKGFWEAGTEPNMADLTLIGQLLDVPREKLYETFARAEYGMTVERINEIFHIDGGEGYQSYGYYDDYSSDSEMQNERNDISNLSFHSSNTPHCYRVIECWTQESKNRVQCWDPIATSQEDAYFKIDDTKKEVDTIKRINDLRRKQCREAGIINEEEMPLILMEKFIDTYWYYTFMSPEGDVLCQGETPYDHKSHPFTLMLYPYTNGKIFPYMSFVIDQQRNINRLNIMNDLAIRSATKGLTIIPTDIVPDDMTRDDFTDQVTSYRGIVYYKLNRLNPQARPDILTSNAVNLGINEMLQMKINMMQQVANVSGALQGKTPSAGTSASRYAMETENSTTSLFTLLNDFSRFAEELALKNCELIKQYYEDGRLIFSDKSSEHLIEYDRMSARDVKFKISIKESAATAAYQHSITNTLNLLLERQAIDILQYLDNSPEPFAKDLAEQIRTAQKEQNLAQANLQVPGADQQKVAQAEQMMQSNYQQPQIPQQ